MKIILSTLAAVVLAGAMFVQPAQAACWSNGFVTQCNHHQRHWWGQRDGWHHHGWRDHGWRDRGDWR